MRQTTPWPAVITADTKQVNNEGGDGPTDDTNPELKSYCEEMAEAQKMLDNLKK